MLASRPTFALIAIALTLTVGCSRDRHEVNSTPHLPATMVVIDTVGGETLWSMDVPAGQRLVYDFNYTNSNPEVLRAPNTPPTTMNWWLYPSHAQSNYQNYSKSKALDSGTVELPGTPIRTEVFFRKSETATSRAQPLLDDPAAAPIRLELNVNENGAITFDGQPHANEEIARLFRSLYGQRAVIVTGTPGTPRANMIALRDIVKDNPNITVIVPPARPNDQADEAEAPADDDANDAIDDAMEGM